MNWFGKKLRYRKSTVSNQNCGIAHILGILLMNSCNTDIFFSNSYHLQSVRFEYLLRQTAGVVRISWQACWSKSSICTLGFSITKCFISFRQRLEMSKGKNTFHEWKRSKRPSMSYPRAKPTRFKPTLTSGKRLLWYFWCAMLEVKKNSS